jgi:hypothetical protein
MQARWRVERAADGRVNFLLWAGPGPEEPVRLPMSDEEAFALVRGADRVTSWAASSAEGTMTPGPATPEEVRRQLAIYGYIVVSPDIEAHTRLVAATPWATWVEEVPAPSAENGIAWFVNVFAVDDAQFGQAALSCGATRHPTVYTGSPGDG